VRLESVRGIAPFPVITRRMAIGSASGSPFSITTKTTSIAGGRHNSIRLGLYGVNVDQWWEEAFEALKAFKAREGHCYVPALHVEGEVHLGHWMTVQRRCRKKMNSERKRRLDKIGLVWNGTYTKAIKHSLAALRSKRHKISS